MIPLSVPEIRGQEWEYIKDCLDTGWVSSVGSYVTRFERECAARAGRKYAVATVNGTAALHIALLVAGIQPGDGVLVSDLTFIAPANAIRYAGANPVLVDAAPHDWQIDVNRIRDFLRRGERERHKIKAILPVDILGHPVDMPALIELAREFDLIVIEDASEALGAPVGRLSDIACFSFNGNKIITTGGGGMIVTDREDWAEHARHLTTQAKSDAIEYVHDEIGFNYRMTNVAAAMGCAQMEMLDEFLAIKRANAATYTKALNGIPGITTMPASPCSSYWLYTILIDENEYGMSSRDLLANLADTDIQARPLWQPIHKSIPYRDAHVLGGQVAERLYRDALSLPSSVGLKPDELSQVVEVIARACR